MYVSYIEIDVTWRKCYDVSREKCKYDNLSPSEYNSEVKRSKRAISIYAHLIKIDHDL